MGIFPGGHFPGGCAESVGKEEMRETLVELKRVSENWWFCDKVGAAFGGNILIDIIDSLAEGCRREDWVN